MDSSLNGKKFGVVHTSPTEMLAGDLELGKLYFAQGAASGAAKQGVYALTNSTDTEGVAELTMFGTGAVADGSGYGLSQCNFTEAYKTKLDGIATGANNYSLPVAAANTRGGIQVGFTAKDASIPVNLSGEDAYVQLTKTSIESGLGYTINASVPSGAKFTDTVYVHPVAGTATQNLGNESKGTTVTPGTLTKIATIYDASFDASGHFKGKVARDISVNISKPSTAGTADKVANTLTIKVEDTTVGTFNGGAAEEVNIKTGNSNTLTVSGTSNGSITITPITADVSSNSIALATGAQIQAAIQSAVSTALSSALQYKGTVADGSVLPTSNNKVGDVYVASGSYTTTQNSISYICETGDLFIYNGTYFDIVNGENQVSNANATLAWNSSTKIATVDGTDIYVKLPSNPNTDTKVTTSASTSKLFLIGKTDASKATTSAANYNASVYIDGNYLYSGGTKVLTAESYKGTVTSITPGTGLTGTSSDAAITSSGTINLKPASTSELGGIIASNVLSGAVALTSANGSTASRYYGVQVDNTGKAFVNIPWTDTNTDTKVTSVGNHYTPTANASSALSADASSATAATWGSTDLVTGVNIQRDAAGHVTGVTVDSIQMPANPNTDTKVTTSASTSKLFLIGKIDASKDTTSAANYNANVYINTSNQIVASSGAVASGNTALVTGGTVYTAVAAAQEAATIYWEVL